MRDSYLPLCTPSITDAEIAAVTTAMRSGWLSTGPKVREFEEAVSAYTGAKHAIAVSSCTAALQIALAAHDIGPGDEVITTPITFVSTANVVIHQGARPVFADIDPRTFNISPATIERQITKQTRAIIPVHYAGLPCDMDAILAIARQHNLVVIEDAAHAIGTIDAHGRQIGGNDETMAAFSFYATKTMTTGEGGVLTTSDPKLAETARHYSLHGITKDAWKRYSAAGTWYYEVLHAGFKANMTDPEASLGLVQLSRLESFIERREAICQRYDEAFRTLPELITPLNLPGVRHSRYIYPLLVRTEYLKIDRAEFITKLRDLNIGTSVHFIPVHLHPFYRDEFGHKPGDFPVSEWMYERVISLPLFPDMTDEDAGDVIEAVRYLVETNRS
ncbi:MAG: DegT/DnrJ/EryC1/StrS aminotransferase family protein [Dehalococcoidia bacterium]